MKHGRGKPGHFIAQGRRWMPLERIARTMWCPMVRTSVLTGAGAIAAVNRDIKDDRCIGSDCMMWRWERRDAHNGNCPGYCGLAGKPAEEAP